MLNSELHRKVVLELYRSLTRGALHLPLLLDSSQKPLVNMLRKQLKLQFHRHAPLTRDFKSAHEAISTAIEWDTLITRAFEDPQAVAPLVAKLTEAHVFHKEYARRDRLKKQVEAQFDRAENNQNIKFQQFMEKHRAKLAQEAQSRPLSPEEQQHRDMHRLHNVFLRRLQRRIPRRIGRNQQLFTKCVLSANRNHQRDVYKSSLKLKRRERGYRVKEQRGGNVSHLLFLKPRHGLAPQSWEFGRIVSVLYQRYNNLMNKYKNEEARLADVTKQMNQKVNERFQGDTPLDVPAMQRLSAEKARVESAMKRYSSRINLMKKKMVSEYPIIMRRIKRHQRVVDRMHPKLVRKARAESASVKMDSNLARLYR